MTIQKQRLLALIEYVQQSARMRTRIVSNVTDLYSRVSSDESFRREECDRVGLGFSLPR